MRCFKLAATATLLLLILVGCSKPQSFTIQDTLPEKEDNVGAKTGSVGIYMDVTPSMEGFLARPDAADNHYITCLDEISRIISVDYDSSAVSYYRVDTPVWKTNENVLLEAKNAAYYEFSSDSLSQERGYQKMQDGDKYNSPCLSIAIELGKSEDLFVLITDFYENTNHTTNDTQVTTLINSLKSARDLSDGKVYGIVAIRSGFAGKIYDAGPNGETVIYGMEEEKNRPFYVIVRGYPEIVDTFCDRLKERLNLSQDACNSYVFSRDTFCLDYRDFDGYKKKYDKHLLWNDGDIVTINSAVDMSVFSYRKGDSPQDRVLVFSYLIPTDAKEYFQGLIEKNGILTTTEIGEEVREVHQIDCSSDKKTACSWSGKDGSFLMNDAEPPFEIAGVYCEKDADMLYVKLHLMESKLLNGIWRIQWESHAETERENVQPWWYEWNCKNRSDDYSKTERLTDYFASMMQNLEEIPPFLEGVLYLTVGDNA